MMPPDPSAVRRFVFTTSWDDGHPLDLRIAEVLARRGFAGTFYIPAANREGREVLDDSALRRLAATHEIGSHTATHRYLAGLSRLQACEEIESGKRRIEDAIGRSTPGFCYPGGHFSDRDVALVRDAGFVYARTVDNLCIDAGSDPFRMPTTIQFYDHSRSVLARNFASRGHWPSRAAALATAVGASGLVARLVALLKLALARGQVFHLWGHSWEIEAFGGWKTLDQFLGIAADLVPAGCRVDNHGVARFAGLVRSPARDAIAR